MHEYTEKPKGLSKYFLISYFVRKMYHKKGIFCYFCQLGHPIIEHVGGIVLHFYGNQKKQDGRHHQCSNKMHSQARFTKT